MSGTDILVVVLCAAGGYGLVSILIDAKRRTGNATADSRAGGESRTEFSRRAVNSPPAPPPPPPAWCQVLQVPESADAEKIRRAYRLLMSQYHPDKVASLGPELRELAERKSKEITTAYRDAMLLKGVDA